VESCVGKEKEKSRLISSFFLLLEKVEKGCLLHRSVDEIIIINFIKQILVYLTEWSFGGEI